MAQIWHKLAQIGTKPPLLAFTESASYSVAMSIDDHPARANHAHNQKAQRIADKAAKKLSDGKIQAGKDYPKENLEAAQGIASVFELQIRDARLDYEFSLKQVEAAQNSLKDLYQKDQDEKLKFAEDMSLVNDIINDCYKEIDEIIPIPTGAFHDDKYDQYDFGAYIIEGIKSGLEIKTWSEEKGEFTDDVADRLNALNFQETAALVKKQEALKKAVEKREQLTEQHDVFQKNHPARVQRIEHELQDRLFASGLALQKLEHKAAMRSAEVKQAIAIHDPDEFAPSQKQKNAEAIANLAKAKAYEAGANDEQAQDIWEMNYVEDFYAEELEQARESPEIHFEDEEKKAVIAERDRLAQDYAEMQKSKAESDKAHEEQIKKVNEEVNKQSQKNEVLSQALSIAVGKLVKTAEYTEEQLERMKKKVNLEIHPTKDFWPNGNMKPVAHDKRFINDLQPIGRELDIHFKVGDDHAQRQMALRAGVYIDKVRFRALIKDHAPASNFPSSPTFLVEIMEKGQCSVSGKQLKGVEVRLTLGGSRQNKLTVGTALNKNLKWTTEFENSLHPKVPKGACSDHTNSVKQLIAFNGLLELKLFDNENKAV